MSSNYNPNMHGWGFAAVICLITAGLFFTARTIHTRTYRHPRDPMNQQVYRERDLEKKHFSESPDAGVRKDPGSEKH